MVASAVRELRTVAVLRTKSAKARAWTSAGSLAGASNAVDGRAIGIAGRSLAGVGPAAVARGSLPLPGGLRLQLRECAPGEAASALPAGEAGRPCCFPGGAALSARIGEGDGLLLPGRAMVRR